MKALKITLAILLALCALGLGFFSLSTGRDLPALLARMDPAEAALSDAKMLKARDRVYASLQEDDRQKTLSALDRYLKGFGDRLSLEGETGFELQFYRHGPALIALGAFFLCCALALLFSFGQGLLKKVGNALALISALYCSLYILEQLVGAESMLIMVLRKGAIFALIAVSMNLLNGFTGLFSLGQAGFMLVGAYTYAIFTIPVESRPQVYQYFNGGLIQFQLPVLLAIVLAGLAAAAFAFLIGLPVLRLKSDYLAIATLGFAEIIRAVFQYDGLGPITNGSNLLRRFPTFDSILFPFAVSGVCIALMTFLIHSTYGRAFKAIRDDEVAAEAMGISLFRHKQMSFVTSSFFAGIGGALLAMYQTTVQAAAFTSAMTYQILLVVVIGGMGSITGSIIASFLFIASSEWWLRFLDNAQYIGTFKVPLLRSGFRMVVFSAVIMAVVLFYRQGIMGDREWSFHRLNAALEKMSAKRLARRIFRGREGGGHG